MNTRLSVLLAAGGALMMPAFVLAAPASLVEAPPTPQSGQKAPSLRALKLEAVDAASMCLRVEVPGLESRPRLQMLHNPERVVLDLLGVQRGTEVSLKQVRELSHPLIRKSRLAQFVSDPTPVTRLVLEVEKGVSARVIDNPEGMVLELRDSTISVAPVLAAATNVELRNEDRADASKQFASEALRPLPSTGAPFKTLPMLLTTVLDPTVHSPQEKKTSEAPVVRQSVLLGTTKSKYSGAPITIEMQKSDLTEVLRALADLANMDIIHDSDLDSIKIAASFNNRPWDHVLDVICRQHGLGTTMDNGILRVAKLETLRKEEEANRQLAEARALAGELVTRTRPLSFAKASEIVGLIDKVKTSRGSLIVDDRTNTLFISDLPRQMPLIMDFINSLDVPIKQVTVEAKIVEANIGWNQAFGVKWPTSNGGGAELTVDGKAAPWGSFNGPAWNSVNNRATTGNAVGAAFSGGKEGVTSIPGAAGELWLSFLSPRISINAILQAAESQGNLKIVSTPKVTTFNNQMGRMLSGEKIPYPTIQAGGNQGAITVAFVEANLGLEVTPQINNDGTVMMKLKLEKSEADFSRQVNGQPTIIRREVETNVLVQDGGTAVLGGVYVKRSSKDTSGVPFLAKLPVIGGLFRNKTTKEENKELLMFITPRIEKN